MTEEMNLGTTPAYGSPKKEISPSDFGAVGRDTALVALGSYIIFEVRNSALPVELHEAVTGVMFFVTYAALKVVWKYFTDTTRKAAW